MWLSKVVIHSKFKQIKTYLLTSALAQFAFEEHDEMNHSIT